MRTTIIIPLVVGSLAIIVYTMLNPLKDFDKKVQRRLELSGFGRVRNIKELNASVKNIQINKERFEALMCVPNDKFRKGLMKEFINGLAPEVLKVAKSSRDSLAVKFIVYLGFTKEFATESVKYVRDTMYIPRQIGVD